MNFLGVRFLPFREHTPIMTPVADRYLGALSPILPSRSVRNSEPQVLQPWGFGRA